MRLFMASTSIADQVAQLQCDIDELKTAQPTSQNSGMLAHINRGEYTTFGDIVEWTTLSNKTPQYLAHLPLVATPASYHYFTIYGEHIFSADNQKPTVAVPSIELEVKSGGLSGKSEFYMNAGGYGYSMIIRNSSGTQIGNATVKLSQLGRYRWRSEITYTASQNFTMAVKFILRASDTGAILNRMEGTW